MEQYILATMKSQIDFLVHSLKEYYTHNAYIALLRKKNKIKHSIFK